MRGQAASRTAKWEPKPRKPCPVCSRIVSVVADGSPRTHSNTNGDPCSGGNRKGSCSTCGREVLLYRDGTARPHKQVRVRAGRKPAKDGWLDTRVVPETYSSKTDCPGAGEPAEVD